MPAAGMPHECQIPAAWLRTGLILGILVALVYWIGCKIYHFVPSWGSVWKLVTRGFKG